MVQVFLLFSEWGLFLLRVGLGFVLIGHGWPKLRDLGQSTANFRTAGLGMYARPTAIAAAIIESVAGLFLVFGFFTQLAAVVVAIEMLIVLAWHLRRHHRLVGARLPDGQGYEVTLLLLVGVLALAANGSVLYSLDGFFGILF